MTEVEKFLDWLISMDEPQDFAGMKARQTANLTAIINRARAVRPLLPSTPSDVPQPGDVRTGEDGLPYLYVVCGDCGGTGAVPTLSGPSELLEERHET